MPVIRAQVVWPFFTNLPTDVYTNTFHFDEIVPQTLEEAGDDLVVHLRTFYQLVYGTTYLANYMVPSGAHVNFYRMDQPPPRVPYTLNLTMGAMTVNASTLPTEVACCMSFQGDPLGGTPQARRRGRIYLGGISSQAIVVSSNTAFPIWNALFTAGVRVAGDNLMDDVVADGLRWVVWSPTDGVAVPITNGWVDNTPDTQRRRGVDPTSRSLWPV